METTFSNLRNDRVIIIGKDIDKDAKDNSSVSDGLIKSLQQLKLDDKVKIFSTLDPDNVDAIEANGFANGNIAETIKIFELVSSAANNPEKAENLFSGTSGSNVIENMKFLASVSDTANDVENDKKVLSSPDEEDLSEISKPRVDRLHLANKENIIVLITLIITKLLKAVYESMGLLAKKNDLANDLLLKLNSVSSLLGGINSGLALDEKENATLEGNEKSIAIDTFGQSGNSSAIVPKDEWFKDAHINLKDNDKIDKIIDVLIAKASEKTGKDVKLLNWGEFLSKTRDMVNNKNAGLEEFSSNHYCEFTHDGEWKESLRNDYGSLTGTITHYPWLDAQDLWAGTQLYFLKDALKKYADGTGDLNGLTKDKAPMIDPSQLEQVIGSFFAVNNMTNIIDNVQASDFRQALNLNFAAGSAIEQASKDPSNSGTMYMVAEDLITDKSKCKMYKDEITGEKKYFVDKEQLKNIFNELGLRLISILGESCGDTMSALGKQIFSSNKASFSSLLGIVDSLKKQVQTAQSKLSNQISELQKLLQVLQETLDKAVQLNGIK